MSNVKAGKYKAKIADYGAVQNAKGETQIKVTFDLLDLGEKYSWFGNVTNDVGQKITTKNLITMGANPSNIDKVELGKNSDVLNTEKTFELVIEEREYNSKKYLQVKYINDPSAYKSQEYTAANGAFAGLKGIAAAMVASGEAPKNEPKKADAGF